MLSMRFCRLLIMSAFICVPCYANHKTCESHTFFVPRQITTNSIFELALNQNWFYAKKIENSFQFEISATPFFQQSKDGKCLAGYFLRGGKTSLVFDEINNNPQNICSLWFGIESDLNTQFFNGTLCMEPERRSYGSYFSIDLSKRCEKYSLWFQIGFAAMRTEHKLNMSSAIQEVAGPLSNFNLGTIDEFDSIICALNNPDWNFGKFSQCKQERSGVDDVQVKLGFDWFHREKNQNHLSAYIVGTIPTGKKQESTFIFEPLVGSKNGSIGIGCNTDFTWQINSVDLTWLFDINYRFRFSAEQCRSFDLCANGEWSRYLLVVPQDQHLNTQPGINLFSLNASVKPGNTIDLWTAFNLNLNSFALEIGYNFWWKKKEEICLRQNISETFGIFDLAGMNGVPQSASTANISQSAIGQNQASSDVSFVTLTTSDLNLDSAAHPKALSSTVYCALGWHPTTSKASFLIGFGGQYEFAHNNSALEQWAVWGKLGVMFDFFKGESGVVKSKQVKNSMAERN